MLLLASACFSQKSGKETAEHAELRSATLPKEIIPIEKSDEEWKQELTPFEYYVLREKGTERAFAGDLNKEKRKGVYTCRACTLPLFDAATKFNSGTGWPSFFKPVREDVIAQDVDYHIGYARMEVMCGRCGGHLGHVFEDGPKPTGLRYCINAASLDFKPDSQ